MIYGKFGITKVLKKLNSYKLFENTFKLEIIAQPTSSNFFFVLRNKLLNRVVLRPSLGNFNILGRRNKNNFRYSRAGLFRDILRDFLNRIVLEWEKFLRYRYFRFTVYMLRYFGFRLLQSERLLLNKRWGEGTFFTSLQRYKRECAFFLLSSLY